MPTRTQTRTRSSRRLSAMMQCESRARRPRPARWHAAAALASRCQRRRARRIARRPPIDPARQALGRPAQPAHRRAPFRSSTTSRRTGAPPRRSPSASAPKAKACTTKSIARKKAVNHGVWKHYKLQMIEPRAESRASSSPTCGRSRRPRRVHARSRRQARRLGPRQGLPVRRPRDRPRDGRRHARPARDRRRTRPARARRSRARPAWPSTRRHRRPADARRIPHPPRQRRPRAARSRAQRRRAAAGRRRAQRPATAEKLNRAIEKKRDRLTSSARRAVR